MKETERSAMKTERELITQMLNALDACRDWPGAHNECTDAVIAAREYLAAPTTDTLAEQYAKLAEQEPGSMELKEIKGELSVWKKEALEKRKRIAELEALLAQHCEMLEAKLAAVEQSEPSKAEALEDVLRQGIHGDFSTDVPENLTLALNARAELYTLTHPAPQPKAEPEIVAYEGMPQGMGDEPEESEPVAEVVVRKGRARMNWDNFSGFEDGKHKLYTTPQPTTPEKSEPVKATVPLKKHFPQCVRCNIAYVHNMADDCGWACDGKNLFSEIKAP